MFEISVFRVEVIKWPPLVFPVTLATDETAQHCIAGSEAASGTAVEFTAVEEEVVEIEEDEEEARAQVKGTELWWRLKEARRQKMMEMKMEVVEDGEWPKEVKMEVVEEEKMREEEDEWYAKAAEPPPPKAAGPAAAKKGLLFIGKFRPKAKAIPPKAMPKPKVKPGVQLKCKVPPPAKPKQLAKGSVAAMLPAPAKPKQLAKGSVAAQLPAPQTPEVAGLGLKIVFRSLYILNESLMFSPSRVFNA